MLSELDVREDMSDLFETFDLDGDGRVALAELLRGLKKLRGDARRSDVVEISLQGSAIYHTIADFQTSTEKALHAQGKLLAKVEQSLSTVLAVH